MKKRQSIRSRVQIIVMLISVLALICTSIIGIVSMRSIRNRAADDITSQSRDKLLAQLSDKSELAEETLGKYASDINYFTDYLHRLYVHPEQYVPREIEPTSEKNAGINVIQIAYGSEDVYWDDIKDSAMLLANAEDIFRPIIEEEDSKITAIYLSEVSGYALSFDAQSDIKPQDEHAVFPIFEAYWYKQAGDRGNGYGILRCHGRCSRSRSDHHLRSAFL